MRPDALIFDVDGVLIDADESYPGVAREAVRMGFSLFLGRDAEGTSFGMEHFLAAKRHPAFYDDYDIAWAFVAAARERAPDLAEWKEILATCPSDAGGVSRWIDERFGGAIPPRDMRDLCEELYFGAEYESTFTRPRRFFRGEGFWRREHPLFDRSWRALPLPCAIYTGRPLRELALALKQLRWEDFPPELAVTPDSGLVKPSPEGLVLLCERLGASTPAFFGDSATDAAAQHAFGKGLFMAVGETLQNVFPRYATVTEALRDLGIFS